MKNILPIRTIPEFNDFGAAVIEAIPSKIDPGVDRYYLGILTGYLMEDLRRIMIEKKSLSEKDIEDVIKYRTNLGFAIRVKMSKREHSIQAIPITSVSCYEALCKIIKDTFTQTSELRGLDETLGASR